jgi:large subunit ribosomal protein L18
MVDTKAKASNLARRRRRVRAKVKGTAERPRLCVTRSNTNIYAQLIDDVNETTVLSASTIDATVRASIKRGSNIEAAHAVGEALGRTAKEAGYTRVVFDRGGNLYHGRVKAVADGAREAGLEF